MTSRGIECRGKGTNYIDCIDRVDHCGNWNPRSVCRALHHRSDSSTDYRAVGATVCTVGVKSTGVVKGIDYVSQFESQE